MAQDRLDRIEELLLMTATQTAENAKQLDRFAVEWRESLQKTRAEHDREMKEIKMLFKEMIKRIAV